MLTNYVSISKLMLVKPCAVLMMATCDLQYHLLISLITNQSYVHSLISAF